MRVCELSQAEAVQLEQQGVIPNCAHHHHTGFLDALSAVENEVYRWVTAVMGENTKRRVTKCTEILYFAGRPSCTRNRNGQVTSAVQVMQGVTHNV